MNKIYIITLFATRDLDKIRSLCYTWGWVPTFEDAEEVIMGEDSGMGLWECLYDLAVIEEAQPGCAFVRTKEVGWYKCIYGEMCNDPVTVEKIDKPDVLKNTVCFWG